MASVGVELDPRAPDELREGIVVVDRVEPVDGAVGNGVGAEIVTVFWPAGSVPPNRTFIARP